MSALPTPTARTVGLWLASVALLVTGVALGNQNVVWPALFLAFLPLVALVTLIALRPRLHVERAIIPPTVGVGETATVHLTSTIQWPSPAGLVVAEDDPGRALGGVHHLRIPADQRGERTTSTYSLRPQRRGRHSLDGLRIRYGDVWGMWVQTTAVRQSTPFAVTPAVVPLPPGVARAFGATGETPIPQTAVSGPDDAMVRDYQPRDDVRRIHWPSTARTGTLMVRREEAAWDPTAWVILDSRLSQHPRTAGLRPTFEALVQAAASIGIRLLSDGYDVTLVDAAGMRHEVAAGDPSGRASWLDPFVDVDVVEVDDLHAATLEVAQASSEHLIVALLGTLDRATADLLAATTGSRQDRLALVLTPVEDDRPDFEDGQAVLVTHGWRVRALAPEQGLADAWAPEEAWSR